MDHAMATDLVRRLAAATGGTWPDDSVDHFIGELMGLPRSDLAREAIVHVARTWTRGVRPTFGVIYSEYQDRLARDRAQEGTAISYGNEKVPTFHEGIRIAANSYAAECQRQGREPNWSLFERFIDAVPSAPVKTIVRKPYRDDEDF